MYTGIFIFHTSDLFVQKIARDLDIKIVEKQTNQFKNKY